jgi:hypothetical protein
MPDAQPSDEADHTHYCEDCEVELAILYDDREDESVPLVCGHCGGNNTRRLVATDGGLPPWAERVEVDGRELIRCTVCGNTAADLPLAHDCIYANDLVADGGSRETVEGGDAQQETDVVHPSEEELTVGERALAEATYGTPYEEMDEWKQSQFIRLLDDLPEHLRAGLSGKLLTKEQVDDGMEDVFETMVEDDDLPEEWKDGAAVFAKGLKKKFGIDGGPSDV